MKLRPEGAEREGEGGSMAEASSAPRPAGRLLSQPGPPWGEPLSPGETFKRRLLFLLTHFANTWLKLWRIKKSSGLLIFLGHQSF
ncbi:hypothetical protein CapIbe_008650 [Capra ibex]